MSLTVADNQFVVITGPNGGGKTTLAKAIMGLVQPTGGTISWNGTDITHMAITDRARLGVSYGFQQPPRFKGLKVRDLLALAAGSEKLTREEGCQYLTKVGLCAGDYIDREVDASLSGGEVKRIEIATILARKAGLMIFDEPEAGIDLWSFAKLTETFQAHPPEAGGHPHRHLPPGAHHRPGRRDRHDRRRQGAEARPQGRDLPRDPGQHQRRVQLSVGRSGQ